MKIYNLVSIVIFIYLLVSCHPLKRIEYRNTLTASKNALNNQVARFQILEIQNDSIYKEGFHTDSTYEVLKKEIRNQKNKLDSSSLLVNTLLRKVNFRVAFNEEFYELKPKIKKINQLVAEDLIANNSDYTQLEKRVFETELNEDKVKFNSILNSASEKQTQATETIKSIGNSKEIFLQSGSISESIAANIDNRLLGYQTEIDSISNEIMILKRRIDQPSDFSKNFTTIKAKVILIDSVVNKKTEYQQYVFKMIEDGLSKSKRNLFNLAAFFGPGGHMIPTDKYEMAKIYFSPIVDSLLKFSNTYSEIFRTAQVVINGYADGMKIMPGTELYKKIKNYIKVENPTKEQLNAGLSALRAEEISKLIDRFIKERANDFKTINKITFELLEAGEGEKLPDSNIKNYKENDERRRIVLIYWSVLPNK